MGVTNISGPLQVAGVPTQGMNGLPVTTGNVWWVSSLTGADGMLGTTPQFPFGTLGHAISVAASGDMIVLMQGHAETVTAAAGIAINVAGLNIVGLGVGDLQPTFTFSTSTAATITMTAANVSMTGIRGTSTIDQIVSPFVVSGTHCTLGLTWFDQDATHESLRAVLTTAAANDFTCNLTYHGYTAGTHNVNAVRLVGGRNANINVNYYGVLTTAVVEFVTTATVDTQIQMQAYVSGVTNQSKLVVDTITGSTWSVAGFDMAAGLAFDGSSGKAISGNDVSTVLADLAIPSTDSTANVLERDVIGSKADTAVTATGTTKSLQAYAKGNITNWGTVVNSGGTASLGAILGDFANTTLVSKLVAGTANGSANVNAADVTGNKTDTAVYNPTTTASMAAYLKGNADLQEGVSTTAAAVMSNALTVFTIAGGPIQILSLQSICATANNATASTLQWTSNGTLGSTTGSITGASATLANAVAGTNVASQLTALATAPVINANGVNILATSGGIVVPAGTLALTIGTGSTTGTWSHYIRYRPLAKGVTVTNAF